MNTFKKSERLCDRKSTENLFSKGISFFEEPFRCIYLKVDEERVSCLKTQIVIPKRNIPKAVNRNLIKIRVYKLLLIKYKMMHFFFNEYILYLSLN